MHAGPKVCSSHKLQILETMSSGGVTVCDLHLLPVPITSLRVLYQIMRPGVSLCI